MSNAKPATSSKGSKKGKGEAPDPPVLDASAPAELARAFSNAWTVDVTRASSETMPKRTQAIGAALKLAPESMRLVLDALVGYVPLLGEVDAVMTRDSKTPKERETRKPWQSRLAGVGVVAHALRFAQSDEADAGLAALLATSTSEMVREEIVKALLGDAALGTQPGALEPLTRFLDDPACTDLALLRAGFRSLYTMSPKKAHERWRKVLTAPDVANPRSVWLAKIAFEQMEAHKADVDDLAPVVFPLIKLPKSARGEDLQTAAVRYAGLTRDHYLALVKYVTDKDDAQVLVDAVAERFYWASLGAGGVKQEEVRPHFKTLEKRYLEKGDNARASVFTKLLAGLVREGNVAAKA
jgi:hypothetical protein